MKRRLYDYLDLCPSNRCRSLYALSFNTQYGCSICHRTLFLVPLASDFDADWDRDCILEMEVSVSGKSGLLGWALPRSAELSEILRASDCPGPGGVAKVGFSGGGCRRCVSMLPGSAALKPVPRPDLKSPLLSLFRLA